MQIVFQKNDVDTSRGLESADEAVITGITVNLAKKGKTQTVGLHFAIKAQNGMVILDIKMLLYPFISCNGQELLFPTLHLYLVKLSENFKQRFVLESPGCEAGQIQIGNHGNIVEDRGVIYQS